MELDGFWAFIFIIIASTIFMFMMTRGSAGKSSPPKNNEKEDKAQ